MPRLFTGLAVPAAVAEALSRLRGGLPGARWVDPADYHVTLSFIGDIDEILADDIAEALAEVQKPAFTVALTGLGSFGGAKPRSVHAVVASSPALIELQAAQEAVLRRVSAPLDSRQFRPHVTLARLGRDATAARTAEWLSLREGDRLTFEADALILYSSRASTGGGPYLVEAAYPLG